MERLDYETHPQHAFKVVVTDSMDHSSAADVFVMLNDMNDNPPTFSQKRYIATVRESATPASVVTQVRFQILLFLSY